VPTEKQALTGHRPVFFHGEPHYTPVYNRGALVPEIAFPAPQSLRNTVATILCAGDRLRGCAGHNLLIEVHDPVASKSRTRSRLAIFQKLDGIRLPKRMGPALRRTSYIGRNIIERRDYSCAVFDAQRRVIAMGDHMPVHLGLHAHVGQSGSGRAHA